MSGYGGHDDDDDHPIAAGPAHHGPGTDGTFQFHHRDDDAGGGKTYGRALAASTRAPLDLPSTSAWNPGNGLTGPNGMAAAAAAGNRRPPPQDYTCVKCGVKGHWIEQCPRGVMAAQRTAAAPPVEPPKRQPVRGVCAFRVYVTV